MSILWSPCSQSRPTFPRDFKEEEEPGGYHQAPVLHQDAHPIRETPGEVQTVQSHGIPPHSLLGDMVVLERPSIDRRLGVNKDVQGCPPCSKSEPPDRGPATLGTRSLAQFL